MIRYISILQERVVANMTWFKQYLEMSDEEKGRDLLERHPYIIDEYIDELESIPNEELQQYITDHDWYEVVRILLETNEYKKIAKKIALDAVKRVHSFDIFDEEIPSWAYFDSPKIVKNEWLIHFTNDAQGIAKSGFTGLVDDIAQLGLTTNIDKKSYNRSKDGYGFSYDINEYVKYGWSRGEWKYGKEAVIFRASGIKVWHVSDEEYQVLFYGPTVTDIIPIRAFHGKYHVGYNKKDDVGSDMFSNEELPKVVDWTINNYSQYRKRLK